jgi:hypothetical protein
MMTMKLAMMITLVMIHILNMIMPSIMSKRDDEQPGGSGILLRFRTNSDCLNTILLDVPASILSPFRTESSCLHGWTSVDSFGFAAWVDCC